MTRPTILVAGIGNIFLGDDAFGSEVARRLSLRQWPDEVKVVDFGIRGLDLAYALLDPCDVTILVDATPHGGDPGTVYTIEPDLEEFSQEAGGQNLLDAHGMNPVNVLKMVQSMGGAFKRILLVGCEPQSLGGDEGSMEMSPPVLAAVDKAVEVVEKLVADILQTGTLRKTAPQEAETIAAIER
ncbi:MAG TPA: hydrogenase maturation protease [Blastocatellia bacterium]